MNAHTKNKLGLQIKVITLLVALTIVPLLPGRALAGDYSRYVLPSPGGGKVYVFTRPGSSGLDLLLADIYGTTAFNKVIWRFYWPDPVPEPVPAPEPPAPVPQPDPQPPAPPEPPVPVPQPDPQPPAPPEEPAPEPKPAPVPTGMTEQEELMVELVNAERVKAGLKPLSVDMRLTELARKKSQDMIDKGYFSHISPTYGSPFDMMKAAEIQYRTAGENLAGAATVKSAHEALTQSEGHRKNILNPAYDHIGVGIIDGGPYGLMVTQMFTGS